MCRLAVSRAILVERFKALMGLCAAMAFEVEGMQEFLGALGLRIGEELLGIRGAVCDLPVGEQNHPVGDGTRELHLMRDDEHRLPKAPATQPRAVVRTLPQCGCGGYLGAPMMFDSFNEMLAYFFVVFSDAQAVNAKHASILNGDACAI